MTPTMFVDGKHATVVIDQVLPDVRRALVAKIGAIATEMASEARGNAAAHIRFLGAKNPGSYLASIQSGVSDKGQRVTGYVRSGHPLAHLLEEGFTISDMMINASAADVMAFDGGAGTVFAKHVHRHETKVQAYPAIYPAFEAHQGEIRSSLEEIAHAAGQS